MAAAPCGGDCFVSGVDGSPCPIPQSDLAGPSRNDHNSARLAGCESDCQLPVGRADGHAVNRQHVLKPLQSSQQSEQRHSLLRAEVIAEMDPGVVSPDADQAAMRLAASCSAALCTIVGIEGSFSRRLGVQIAIANDGTVSGSLAAGCLERELATQAMQARASGAPRLLRYGRGSPFIDFRMPCGSGLDIVVDPAPERVRLGRAIATLDARKPVDVPLPVDRVDCPAFGFKPPTSVGNGFSLRLGR